MLNFQTNQKRGNRKIKINAKEEKLPAHSNRAGVPASGWGVEPVS